MTLEDDPWSGTPPRSDLCEWRQALIGEKPFISCRRILSETVDPEGNLPVRFARVSRVQKILFDDGEPGPVSGYIFR
jgi:hypothetical protein